MDIEKEKKYLQVIAEYKILAVKAFTEGKTEKAEEYRKKAKLLNKIKEDSKLDELGKKGEKTLQYLKILNQIDKNESRKSNALKSSKYTQNEKDDLEI